MLEQYLNQAEKTNADIVISKYREYDENQKKIILSKLKGLNLEYINNLPVFSRKDIPDHIFNITNPAVWNKFFRKSFVDREGIICQVIPNAEDVYFTYISLCCASRISWVEDAFVNYRIGRVDSLENQKFRYPLCFIEAETAVFDELHRRSLFEEVESSFVNRAIQDIHYGLWKIKMLLTTTNIGSENPLTEAEEFLKREFFPYTGLLDYPDSFYTDISTVHRLRKL